MCVYVLGYAGMCIYMLICVQVFACLPVFIHIFFFIHLYFYVFYLSTFVYIQHVHLFLCKCISKKIYIHPNKPCMAINQPLMIVAECAESPQIPPIKVNNILLNNPIILSKRCFWHVFIIFSWLIRRLKSRSGSRCHVRQRRMTSGPTRGSCCFLVRVCVSRGPWPLGENPRAQHAGVDKTWSLLTHGNKLPNAFPRGAVPRGPGLGRAGTRQILDARPP